MALKLRRGLETDRKNFTPDEGELIYTTDEKKLYVGDGVTEGGVAVDTTLGEVFIEELANVVTDSSGPATDGSVLAYNSTSGDWNAVTPDELTIQLSTDPTPALGGDLDLNENDIIGTGNIDIDGAITATGNITANGNIVLGDNNTDSITIGADFKSSLNPNMDALYDLGDFNKRWRNIYAEGINVNGEISALAYNGLVIGDDSTVLVDPAGNVLNADTVNVETVLTVSQIDANSILTGTIIGDLYGSVVGDDSTVLVDTVNSRITNGTISLENDTITTNLGGRNLRFDSEDEGGITLALKGPEGGQCINVDVTSSSFFGTVTKFGFNATAGGSANPQALLSGDYLGAISYSGYDTNTLSFMPSAVYSARADTKYTPTVDQIRGEHEWLANFGTGTDPAVARMTFNSDGCLAVNIPVEGTAVDDVVLDVYGIARLEPSDAAPSTPVSGMIAVADGINWDPAGTGTEAVVAYLGGGWVTLGSA